MSSSPAGTPLARWLLASLILAIGLGPRIRLPGLLDRAVDLRVQDLLLVVALTYLGTRIPSLRPIWGPWATIFAFSATLLVAGRLLLDDDLSILRTVAFFGRALEAFVLAIAVAGLYRLSGASARRVAMRSLLFAVAANTAWVGYQYVTGTQRTLIGATVADHLVAYGPRLVGEGSAFGAGFFFVFATAFGVALYRLPGLSRWRSVPVVVVGVLGTYLSGSRLSLAGAALCLLVLVLAPRVGGKPNVFAALAAAVAALVIVPRIPEAGRLSEAGVANGLAVRVGHIWGPLWRVLWEHPLIGIGPGRLGTDEYPWTEAHNVALRAALDYGIVIGAVFLAIFITAMLRAGRAAVRAEGTREQQLWSGLAAILIACALVGGMVQETLVVVMSTHLIMLAVGLYAGAELGPLPDRRKRLTPAERRARLALEHISEPIATDR